MSASTERPARARRDATAGRLIVAHKIGKRVFTTVHEPERNAV